MKIFHLIFVSSLLLLISCRKDNIDQSYKECYSEITATSRAHFYKDAKQFGIQRLAADTLTDYPSNPVYREEETIYVLGKLSAIFNAAAAAPIGTPLYDIVFKYQIHKLEQVSLNSLAIEVEDWNYQIEFTKYYGECQNSELNKIAKEFDFEVEDFSIWNKEFVVLTTEKEYVLSHIGNRLKGTIGVIDASPWSGYMYGVNVNAFDMTYSWTDDYDEFVFTHGFGDCIMGCDLFHHWKVRVDHDCNVTFIEDYGDPIPE